MSINAVLLFSCFDLFSAFSLVLMLQEGGPALHTAGAGNLI